MKKYFTIYEIVFIENEIDLKLVSVETDKKEVLKRLDIKNFEIDNELKSEILQDYFHIVKKDGTKIQNKKITINHINQKHIVISEFDKID